MKYYYLATSTQNNVKVFNFDSYSERFKETGKLNYTKVGSIIYFYDDPANPYAKRNIEHFLNEAKKRNEEQ